MTYAQYGSIAASDFNTLVGGNPVTTSGTLNAVWATGGTTAGYGQTAVANVATGATVAAPGQWASLVTNTANSATHQGTSITSVTAPATGGTITYLSAIPTNLTTIYNSRLNAATQGSTTANSATYGSTWSQALTFTHTITFASGDAARYFFNAGGQLKITCSHANTTAGINLLLNNLASNVGTVVMSAPTSGSVTIAGTSYNGITKVGGGGNAPTISSGSGYFAMTTTNATCFTQTASTGPSGYLATFIRVLARSNGTQGSNGDAGSVITINTIWDEVPDGLTAGTGSTTTVTIVPPENVYLPTASWGTPTVTGTVTGA
jgi:hypothetical protein